MTFQIKYIDTHAHALPEYYSGPGELDGVIRRAIETGTAIVNIGTNIDTSRQCIEVIEKYSDSHPYLYAIPGIHPDIVTEMYRIEFAEEAVDVQDGIVSKNPGTFKFVVQKKIENDLVLLEEIVSTAIERFAHRQKSESGNARKIVGIGECGIDLYRLDQTLGISDTTIFQQIKNEIFELQRLLFRGQIELALKYDLPIMIHARESYAEILSILDENFMGDKAKLRGNIHFFAGTPEEARMFLDRGFTVSFTGVITFAKVYEQVVLQVPTDKLLSETDCPFVSPVPMRGKTNEPSYVRFVVEKIAQIKGIDPESCRIKLLENADQLFRLGLRLG